MGARGPLSRHKFDIADIRAAFTLACRRRGLNLDEGVKTTCLADPMGGSSSPYDMKVKRIEV